MNKLVTIKIIHTAIWVFFNIVLIYLYYAVISNRVDILVWIGLGLFAVEGIVLLFFKMECPLTILARKHSSSAKPNFDIYLPAWLARYNKLIYIFLLAIVIFLLIFRLAIQ